MAARGDTVAAIATATGRGAVGIVRISGPHAATIGQRIAGAALVPRSATLRDFTSATGTVLDRGLCLYFPGPASYTGEDLLELHAHGGPAVLRALLETSYAHGARPARPGEFTERAFLNGKLDLLQAESVAALIEASSVQAASAAARACAGDFSKAVDAINDTLRHLRVLLEASIDFGDETDVAEAPVKAGLQALHADLEKLLANARTGARLQQGLDVAIVGKPNSGKSTLLNRLCGEDRAIVTPIPGTTRDILSVDMEIEGLAIRLHDTAGLREATDLVEQEGVRRARDLLARCDIALHLVSIEDEHAAPPGEVTAVRAAGKPVVTVINKLDLIAQPAHRATSSHDDSTHEEEAVYISALHGDGVSLVGEALFAAAGGSTVTDAPFIARARHVHALVIALSHVSAAGIEATAGAIELASEHLRLASRQLEEMTGVYTTEALLGDIFSAFCIGK